MSAASARVVVGVHDGHNASAALVRDGRVELALQEERFTRIKNQGDAPVHALHCALQMAEQIAMRPPRADSREPGRNKQGKDGRDSGAEGRALGPVRVALNGLYMNYGQWRRDTILEDYARSSSWTSHVKQPLKGTLLDRAYRRHKERAREQRLAELGVDRKQLVPVEHHLAHASAAFYTSPWRDEKTLVLTCDGSGDRLSATVSIGEKGNLRRIAQVDEHDSIGRLYALVTRWLGMAPLEHEYKVMGLAPYVAGGGRTRQAADQFAQLFEFSADGLSWRRRPGVPSMYSAYAFIDRMLRGQRFDLIAAGAQTLIEKMLVHWVQCAIRETGIGKVACAGGVFMNVKANLALLNIPKLDDLYIFPSCGDESNSIGAACWEAARSGQRMEALGSIYYGDPITDAEVEQALRSCDGSGTFHARYAADIERKIAESVAAGLIVARASGAAEFGARALGNRSILARADSPTAVRVINQMVKNRDFWMPFAPSVLVDRAPEYYHKPKPVNSPYMMFAFDSQPAKRPAFSAAQHPYDFTTRPHEVHAAHNPGYHKMLQEYEDLTGEAIILNTSFNLHGEPIVFRAAEALDVFGRSGLRHMALGNWWIEKKTA